MRLSVFVRPSFLLLAIASPALVFAQFQPPTDEELKMTADPKAPGAAAVFLSMSETTDASFKYTTYSARIKVLQEKGKELATVELPYLTGDFKIKSIKARTIHSDGTEIPFVGIPGDLLVVKTHDDQIKQKVFTLPDVEVGSILEYSYDVVFEYSHPPPFWEIQQPYFVHKAHYSYQLGSDSPWLFWSGNLPPGVKMSAGLGGSFILDVTDVPPLPNEEWMPPLNNREYQVRFYFRAVDDARQFWLEGTRDWSIDLNHYAEPSGVLKQAASQLVAFGDSDLDKAKKLYKAVQALDNTDFSRTKSKAERKQLKFHNVKHAQDTWTQKSGSSDEIALLYLALARAAGLSADAMMVVNRDKAEFDPGYLSLNQFTDLIVVLTIDGNEITLDPGQKMCPFQTLHWKHAGTVGIRQSAKIRGTTNSPAQTYADNKLNRIADISLDLNGAATGDLRFIITGQDALYWRQLALENDESEVKKQFDHWLEPMTPQGIEANVDHFTGLDNPDVNLVAVIKMHGDLGTTTSKRLMLPGNFFEARGSHPFVDQQKRLEPVDMHFAAIVNDKVVYHLPAGFSLEGTPQDSKISWEGHAVYGAKAIPAQGQITVARSLARAFTTATPEEYNDLHDFYQKIAVADQQQLVLTKSPSAQGN
jgi:hypothetical protein